MLHGLVLFATQLETADTSEVTALHNHAPPLYSAVRKLLSFCTRVPRFTLLASLTMLQRLGILPHRTRIYSHIVRIYHMRWSA